MYHTARNAVGVGLVAVALTGCGMFQNNRNAEKVLSSPTPPVLKDQVIGAAGKVEAPMDINIPNWYVKPPAASENYVWTTGTGFSNDLAMSRKKAMLDSQVQLADKINGVISAMVRQSMRDDQGNATVDRSSSFVKKVIIETAITGHMLEDTRVVSENRGYRTFVLVRYPLGDSNRILKEKLNLDRRDNQNFDVNEEELERELQNRRKPSPSSGSAAPAPVSRAPAREPGPGENRYVEEIIPPQVQAADPLNRYRSQ
jgi:hypothetical protein